VTKEPKILTSFLRYNIAAILATITDFLVFVILIEIFGIWYIVATILSALSGGITAFILNRNWAFTNKRGRLSKQAIRYFFVWGGSILLVTAGLFVLVESTNINEIFSKIIISIAVGFGFNFLMYKYFVFK